jgi:hypothetical protein
MPTAQDALLEAFCKDDELGASQAEIAGYIKDMVQQLEKMAQGRDFERLRDLLRLARDEAHRRAGH